MWELNNFKETRVVSNKDHLARCMFYHSIAFEEEYLGKKESRYDFMVRKASLISDPVTSTDNNKVALSKYGGMLELAIFSYLTGKIAWILQNYDHHGNTFHRWTASCSPRKMTQKEMDFSKEYCTFIYYSESNTINSHYNCIINDIGIGPPSRYFEYKHGIKLEEGIVSFQETIVIN